MANHNTVAHAWAHQTGKARKGYNMFYDGPSIYSHGSHWELARLITLPDERPAVMLYEPSRTRSVSTHTHYRYVGAATSHLPQFEVQSFSDHGENYKHFLDCAATSAAKAKRARKYGSYHINDARRSLSKANEYNEAFRLGHDPVTLENFAGLSVQIQAQIEARDNAARQAREKEARAEQRERRVRDKASLRAWLKGLPGIRAPHTAIPFCRVKGDTVETSWGATVPLVDALRLFKVATACRAKGEAWTPCGLWAHKAGDFAVKEVNATGGLLIGCHHIPWRAAKIAADNAGIAI